MTRAQSRPRWRRRQDSNLRALAGQRFSRPPPSAARPLLRATNTSRGRRGWRRRGSGTLAGHEDVDRSSDRHGLPAASALCRGARLHWHFAAVGEVACRSRSRTTARSPSDEACAIVTRARHFDCSHLLFRRTLWDALVRSGTPQRSLDDGVPSRHRLLPSSTTMRMTTLQIRAPDGASSTRGRRASLESPPHFG